MNSHRSWPSELDFFSSLIGKDPQMTQGPGGNTSWKDSSFVWVKASGLHLKSALEESIFVPVSVSEPTRSISRDGMRPSIESFLHACLPERVVYHVHSVGSVAFSIISSLEAKHMELLKSHKLGTIKYVTPGKKLANLIVLERAKNPGLNGVVLGNHGLVVWGQEFESLYNMLIAIENDMCQLLGIDTSRKKLPSELIMRLAKVGFLTPDHVVFADQIKKHMHQGINLWTKDLHWALSLSLSAIPETERPKILQTREIESLLSWSEEKFRRDVQQ